MERCFEDICQEYDRKCRAFEENLSPKQKEVFYNLEYLLEKRCRAELLDEAV